MFSTKRQMTINITYICIRQTASSAKKKQLGPLRFSTYKFFVIKRVELIIYLSYLMRRNNVVTVW